MERITKSFHLFGIVLFSLLIRTLWDVTQFKKIVQQWCSPIIQSTVPHFYKRAILSQTITTLVNAPLGDQTNSINSDRNIHSFLTCPEWKESS